MTIMPLSKKYCSKLNYINFDLYIDDQTHLIITCVAPKLYKNSNILYTLKTLKVFKVPFLVVMPFGLKKIVIYLNLHKRASKAWCMDL